MPSERVEPPPCDDLEHVCPYCECPWGGDCGDIDNGFGCRMTDYLNGDERVEPAPEHRKVADDLAHAIATTMNDDRTEPLTEARARYVQRVMAMLAALAALREVPDVE